MKRIAIANVILLLTSFCNAMQQPMLVKPTPRRPTPLKVNSFFIIPAENDNTFAAEQTQTVSSLEQQICRFLTPQSMVELPSVPAAPMSHEKLFKQLSTFVTHNDFYAVKTLLEDYTPYTDLSQPEPNILEISQQQIKQFAIFSAAIKEQPISQALAKKFNQQQENAHNIRILLQAHTNIGFHNAIKNCDVRRVSLYLAAQAQLGWRDFYGNNAFWHLSSAHNKAAQQLENSKKIRIMILQQRNSQLITAIENGNYNAAQEMITLGASPLLRTNNGETALELAHRLYNPQNNRRAERSMILDLLANTSKTASAEPPTQATPIILTSDQATQTDKDEREALLDSMIEIIEEIDAKKAAQSKP